MEKGGTTLDKICFSQHFCPEFSEKQGKKLKRFTFQDRQKYLRKLFRQLRLSQYDYCSEATMPGNESIEY